MSGKEDFITICPVWGHSGIRSLAVTMPSFIAEVNLFSPSLLYFWDGFKTSFPIYVLYKYFMYFCHVYNALIIGVTSVHHLVLYQSINIVEWVKMKNLAVLHIRYHIAYNKKTLYDRQW